MFFIQIDKIKGAVQKSYHSPEWGGGAVCVIKPYSNIQGVRNLMGNNL